MTNKPPSPADFSYIIDNNIRSNWVNPGRQTIRYRSITISSPDSGQADTLREEIFDYTRFAITHGVEVKVLPDNFFIHVAKQPWFSKCVFLSIVAFGRIR